MMAFSFCMMAAVSCGSTSTEEKTAVEENEDETIAVSPAEVVDADGDGYDSKNDCNDQEITIRPKGVEICDEIDQDCDGTVDEECVFVETAPPEPEEPEEETPFDCNDPLYAKSPEGLEYCGPQEAPCPNGELTRRFFFRDHDADGYGDPMRPRPFCKPPPVFVADHGDCNDRNFLVHPNRRDCRAIWRKTFFGEWVLDVVADGLDNDCDREIDEEAECGGPLD